jgi:hypothetical protein
MCLHRKQMTILSPSSETATSDLQRSVRALACRLLGFPVRGEELARILQRLCDFFLCCCQIAQFSCSHKTCNHSDLISSNFCYSNNVTLLPAS